MKNLSLLIFCLFTGSLLSQVPHTHEHNRAIEFPDVPGYYTVSCDFHQHTVFSDGSVWPDIRVQEALKDSVDAICITDHIEYQPHSADIPHPDRNRSFEVAKAAAKGSDLIVVNGVEVTRDMPPGHSNAIFIEDANKLRDEDPMKVFREARRQGAFVFWNHPSWPAQRPDGIATLQDMHKQLLADTLLHGIEVVNDLWYSEEALQIALDHDLTIMATSDIHGLVDWHYQVPEGGHRPVTLAFARERSAEGIKEALFDRRTVAWYNNLLIGRDSMLVPLLKASILPVEVMYPTGTTVAMVTLENKCDAEFILKNRSEYTFHRNAEIVTLHPNAKTTLEVKTIEKLESVILKFEVLNAISAPGVHPTIEIEVK